MFGVDRCGWKLPGGGCTLINRPTVHTIYPPVAEAAFTAARLVSFARTDGILPMQLLGLLGATTIGLLLARWARRDGRAPWTVAVWCWCPVTVVEIASNAHIDWLAVLFVLAGLAAARAGRTGLSGGLVGAAIATKLYPALVLVSLVRRAPGRVLAAALGVVALSYVLHVAAVGTDVIGFLPSYLKEEQYTNGHRFMLLDLLLPKFLLTPAAVIVMVAVAVWALRHTDPDRPEATAVVVVGAALLVTTPSYAWYALLLLALVALTGRVEWLGVCVLPTVAMLAGPLVGNGVAVRTACYGVGAAIVLAGWWWQRTIKRSDQSAQSAQSPVRPLRRQSRPSATSPTR